MLIDEAVTVPVSSDGPAAVTHCPTASAEWSVATVLLKVVAWVVVTARVALEVCKTKPLALTEVILPAAGAPRPRAAGRAPGPAPPDPPAGHPPPALAGVIMTDVAVTGPVGSAGLLVVAAAPVARAQSPTIRSAPVAGTVVVKLVDGVKVTVTCPLLGFCT
jgi:hypothetical protein